VRQTECTARYEAALSDLAAAGLTYRCSCTRAEIGEAADPAPGAAERRYPGRCRAGPARAEGPFAIRFRVDGFAPETVVDRVQPPMTQLVDSLTGDVVVKRRDGYFAYQLAVVVDDAAQGITDVVRGLDLYDNTPRQRLLQRALKLPVVSYLHLPLVVDRDGGKLAKSRRALPADAARVPETLSRVLSWLRHPPPRALHNAPPQEQLAWAVSQWNPILLQGVTTVSDDA
jgi:glutamyl-Q tRNA(Asp) synthetase